MEPERGTFAAPAGEGAPSGEGSLAHVVDHQRRQNLNLQTALRTRAVIEQAKGIIVARTGTDPENAFQQLVARSQRTNRKLLWVAAELIASAITPRPPPQRGTADGDQALLEPLRPDPGAIVAAAAMIAAPDLNELLGAVVRHARPLGVAAGMLALAEPDGALRIVGHQGMEMHAISGWQRMPPGSGLPITAAAHGRRPVWLHDRGEREAVFPGVKWFPGHREACAAIPIELGRQLVGVIALDWDAPDELSEETRRRLATLAQQCAGPIAQLMRSYEDPLTGLDVEPGHARWFWAFLDGQPIPQLVLEPRIENDVLIDLCVVHANPAASDATRLSVGNGLLEFFPRLAEHGLIKHGSEVLRTGTPHRERLVEIPTGAGTASTFHDLTITRVGTLLIVSWRSDAE